MCSYSYILFSKKIPRKRYLSVPITIGYAVKNNHAADCARKKGGHGGMDFIMAYRLVQTMHEGLMPDYDVYDAAAWSAPFPLSEMSVAKGGAPVKFPDFTRGGFVSPRA